MSYLVFARKWRPQVFEEVVGQEHVTTTLKNAISSGRVAHAYLFSGSRGIGKTTTARILAKALNCQSSDKPVAVPCNKCESCIETTQGRSLDVIEIDGASNRGIDEIRQLRENVKFSPSKGRFKVYIIDEVHQITHDGFNALLKTLEEPPAYVKFIFATTHKHKVMPTILSRCQKFDFKKIPTQMLVDKLKDIIKQENVNIDEDALFMMARSADGSVRDAESLLDQAVSFSKERINTKDVVSMLGTVEEEAFFEITAAIINKDSEAALKIINKITNDGKDLYQFANGLLEHFRNLAVARLNAKADGLIDLPKETIDRIYKQAAEFDINDIISFFNLLSSTHEIMRKSGLARIQLEVVVIKFIKKPLPSGQKDNHRGVSSRPAVNPTMAQGSKTVSQDAPDNTNYMPGASQEINISTLTEEAPKEQNNVVMSVQENVLPDSILTLAEVRSAWQYVINGVKSRKISAALFLMEGLPSGIENTTVTVDFPQKYVFYKEALERNENRCIIEKYLKSAFNRDLSVKFAVVDDLPAAQEEPDKAQSKPPVDANPAEKQETKQKPGANKTEPIVDLASQIFSARIIRKE